MATELENDENSNENRNPAADVKLTIKSNETTFVKLNVRTGMANYKCKVGINVRNVLVCYDMPLKIASEQRPRARHPHFASSADGDVSRGNAT